MTDLRDVLDSAAGNPPAPTPDVVAADLGRGRRALVRRRAAQTAAGLLLTGAAAITGVAVLTGLGGDGGTQPVVPASGGSVAADAVPLVPADTVVESLAIAPALVPQGWRVDGTDYALTVSPSGLTTGPDDFIGKLVVTISPDQTAAPGARHVTVGTADGTVSREDGTTTLVFTPPDEQQLVVQVPAALHWDDATLVRFAQALAVSNGAKAGRG
jgi:hypothetical protein